MTSIYYFIDSSAEFNADLVAISPTAFLIVSISVMIGLLSIGTYANWIAMGYRYSIYPILIVECISMTLLSMFTE